MPVKLSELLLNITLDCCFDSHRRINSFFKKPVFRYGLLENEVNYRTWPNRWAVLVGLNCSI
ncbi:MAG: hypothetical protein ACK5GN_08055 [Pseudomonadota bacterium]